MVAIVVGKVLTIEATRLILEGGFSSIILPVGLEVDPRWVGHSVTVMVDKRDSEWVATSVRLGPRHGHAVETDRPFPASATVARAECSAPGRPAGAPAREGK
jgi:hypothetical protein